MFKIRMFLVAVVVGFLIAAQSVSLAAYEAETPEARELAEYFLELGGGREAWKDVKAVRLLAVNHAPGVELGFLFEIWVNFEKPQMMNRLLNNNFDRLRAYLGDYGWGVKEGEGGYVYYDFEAARLPSERQLWEGDFYRNLWRIATEDETLLVKINDKGQLELHTKGHGLAAWFEFDDDRHLVRFGFPFDTEIGLRLDSLAMYGNRYIPQKGSTDDGVQFEILYLHAFNEALDIPTKAPDDLSEYNPE